MHAVVMAMKTSQTRSRRGEGLPVHHATPSSPERLVATAKAAAQTNAQAFATNHQRTKRKLDDPTKRECDARQLKKARFVTGIAVEIPARPSFQSRVAIDTRNPPTATATATAVAATRPPARLEPQQPKPARSAAIAASTTESRRKATPPASASATAVARKTAPAPAAGSKQQQAGHTKHKEKVANGLKHELNRLQAGSAVVKDQGRKLRSQEATRFKSDLSAYFPDYDEVIGNDPKEHHLLNPETPIIVTASLGIHLDAILSHNISHTHSPTPDPIRSYGDSLYTDLWDSQQISFSFLDAQGETKTLDDPLPDSVFETVHKKAERLERSIRNSEKARAQHEKDQIIRLLGGLQGPDWLRTMGVSGITESRKKTFEPAREHFIKGCEAILDKFRRWAAEEKHRKQQKDHAKAEARRQSQTPQRDEVEADDAGEEVVEEVRDEASVPHEVQDSEEENEDDTMDIDPPDESDDEVSIAKQLREEALAAAKKKTRRGRRATPQLAPPPVPEKAPAKELTSFFQKKYQRDSALSKSRRKGRKVLAFGHPIPDSDERNFELPEDVMDAELMKAHERTTRLRKRARNQR
ncbi:something about silencing, SAS, complex subunit 4-domain-containing protein [Podospora conica]|nr:something about silencing, SAS, complex subunit 4-domain-containing protein [Schizothecium conicum]